MAKDGDDTPRNEPRQHRDAEDVAAQFPDLDRDPRLRPTAGIELPPVPEVTFKRPGTATARGDLPERKAGAADRSDSPGKGETAASYRDAGLASMIGYSLVGAIVGGAGLGWLADRYLLHSGATPWGLLVGLMLGVVSGFYNLIRVTNRLNK